MPDSGPDSGAPWLGWVGSAPMVRVVELPRPYVPEGQVLPADPFGLERLALLTAAFHSGAEPVGLLWVRPPSGGPVELLGLGRSVFPLSARTKPVAAPAPAERLAGFGAWTSLTGRFDELRLTSERERDRDAAGRRPSLESGLLAVWDAPFALAVFAAPVRRGELTEAIRAAADQVREHRRFAESDPNRGVEYERVRAWHRELREAESSGLWWVGAWAGGVDAAASKQVAGLTVASVDLTGRPYTLAPGATVTDIAATKGSAFLAGAELVASMARTPTREVPGIRLVLQSEFDVTAESRETGSDGVQIGSVLDHALRPSSGLRLPLSSLNRHTFVCGATGAGKSQTVRHLLEEATKQGVPWLVLEPAKAEYARMAARLPSHSVIVVRPGDASAIAAGIDPLRPASGFPLQTHLDLVRALFLAAFEADEPFPQVLSAALTKAYTLQGWDVALGEPLDRSHTPRYPTLSDLEQTALQVVEDIGYGREVADNVRGFVRVRLASLRLGTTGRFLEGGHPFDIGKLLRSNVVLEIEDVGDDRDKSFIIGTVLIALTEHLRVAQRSAAFEGGGLRHLTVIEEAHRLLRRTEGHGAAAQAVEMFASLLAEVRAYGEGLVVAEQIPAKLIPDVIKNTAVKIVHRLPARDDRDAVGATMNLSAAQSAYLVTLEPGTAGVFSDGMDQPLLVRMPDGTSVETSGSSATLDARGIVQPFTGRCQADYGLTATTLADMVRGQRLVEDNPLVRWWAEIAVIAHLVGAATPDVPSGVRDLLGRTPESKVIACALAYAVDEAVAARSSALVKQMSPAAFAEHMAGVLTALVENQPPECETPVEWAWLAEPYVWEPQFRVLLLRVRAEQGDMPPHPRLRHWMAALNRTFTAKEATEQLEEVRRMRLEALDDDRANNLVFGTAPVSALESSIDLRRDEADWPAAVRRMLAEVGAPWADGYLILGDHAFDGDGT
ncbi:ATP-binding protein [Flindersiella endophytica]